MQYWLIIVFFAVPVLIGILVQRFGRSKDIVNVLLSFSGAFILAIAVLHILPELYLIGGAGIGKWLLAGFVLQVVLEFFSKGIEHGHTHVHAGGSFQIIVLISLCIHSLLEGIPFAGYETETVIHDHDHAHTHTVSIIGMPLIVGVLIHKLPVTVALVSVLLHSKAKTSVLVAYLLMFASSFPAGVLVGNLLTPYMGSLHKALALAMGMLLHISMTIIFESSNEHRFNPRRFVAVLLGLLGAMLLLS